MPSFLLVLLLSFHLGPLCEEENNEYLTVDHINNKERDKGTGNYTLDRFCALHRNANEQLREASNHVPYQLPEEYTRVGYLLNAIECSDP